jgi:hypothetical protein
MAISILPIDASEPAYTVDVDLSGVVYRLSLAYNTRASHWTIGIGLPDGTTISAGQVIRSNWDLFAMIQSPLLPPGRLFAVDQGDTGADPTADDLGERVLICYDDGL